MLLEWLEYFGVICRIKCFRWKVGGFVSYTYKVVLVYFPPFDIHFNVPSPEYLVQNSI